MLLYEVIEKTRLSMLHHSKKEKDPNANHEYLYDYTALLSYPHYYISASNLLKMSEKIMPNKVELRYKDIALPHDALILSIKDDRATTIDEATFNIFDKNDKIEVHCFFKMTNQKYLQHIFLICTLEPAGDGKEIGADFRLKKNNLKKWFPNEEMYKKAESQLSQYIFNAISQFNLVINKNKDLREGKENRTAKIYRGLKGKKAYRDITIIHLNSHKYLSKKGYQTNNKIDWCNSWIVRGHWRYFSDKTKLGRNRQSERNEMGRTWIMPYQKQTQLDFKNNMREMRQ